MARINLESASLEHPTVRGRAMGYTIEADNTIVFHSPWIITKGNVELVGMPNENAAGWKLGFIQLQFVETNYSTYRGRTVRDGSTKDSGSHSKLCRDTSSAMHEVWYDPQVRQPGSRRGLFCANSLPSTGNLTMMSGFSDSPFQEVFKELQNTRTLMPNFLHHADIAFHFCTMLVAEDPRHQFTVLKHFYWNVRWEAHFHVTADGRPELTHRRSFRFEHSKANS